jgi:hypothetical protein
MTSNRDDLIGKIRALMSKTTVNGCSEAEALAALDKARALMDAYEVTEAELQLNKEETAILRSEPPGSSDPHSVKAFLARGVAEFCSCKAWKGSGQNGIVFCGLPSDARFATWLLDSLAAFVQAELARPCCGLRRVRSPISQSQFVRSNTPRLHLFCWQKVATRHLRSREDLLSHFQSIARIRPVPMACISDLLREQSSNARRSGH